MRRVETQLTEKGLCISHTLLVRRRETVVAALHLGEFVEIEREEDKDEQSALHPFPTTGGSPQATRIVWLRESNEMAGNISDIVIARRSHRPAYSHLGLASCRRCCAAYVADGRKQ